MQGAWRFTAALALAGLPLTVQAEGLPARALTGEGELAYLKSSGSSSQETLKGFSYLRQQRGDWTHELRLEALNESNDDTGWRTRERYYAMEKSSWNFTPRNYLFVRPQFEKDLQSGYDYQAMLALGYGHQFLKSETQLLTVDIGAGQRYSKDRITGARNDEAVANGALKYEWKFRPGARFTEDISVDAGAGNTVTRTRSAVIFALTEAFGAVIAFETRNDDGPVTLKDTITSVGLNYLFK